MPLRLGLAVALAIVAGCSAAVARAQPRVAVTSEVDDSLSWLRVRVGLGGVLLVSPDQTALLGFKGSGLEFEVELGGEVLPWLELDVGLLGGMFANTSEARTGGLLAPLAGVRVRVPGKTYLPYTAFQMGSGFTGEYRRPLLRLGLGLDVRVSRWFTLGPRVGYFNLWPLNRPDATSGARGVEMSLLFGFHPVKVQVERKVVEQRKVQVVRHVPPPPLPLPDPEPDEVVLELLERALPATQQELLAPVLFRFDSAELEPTGVAMLHEVARALHERTDITRVEVRGYADERGKSDHNDALSERRALAVQQWLVEHGVEPERLQVAGRGSSEPVESGSSEEDHEQNRRVVFRVLRTEEQP